MKPTKDLPLFNPKAACIKCGFDDISVSLVSKGTAIWKGSVSREYDNDVLHCTCRKCGHTSDVRPVDQATGLESWVTVPKYKLEIDVKGPDYEALRHRRQQELQLAIQALEQIKASEKLDVSERSRAQVAKDALDKIAGLWMQGDDDEKLARLKRGAQGHFGAGIESMSIDPRLLLLLFARVEKAP